LNRSPWGNPRKSGLRKDLQALAFWLVLIGIIGYLLFPSFFSDLVSRLRLPGETAQTQTAVDTTQAQNGSNIPLVFQEVYGAELTAELSKGFWAIFVRDGQFEQLALSEEAYRFLLGIIDKDRTNGKQRVILSANGQVRQVLVSDEVYDIITQLDVVSKRSKSP